MRMIARIEASLTNGDRQISKIVWTIAAIGAIVLIAIAPARGDGLSNKYCPVTTSELAEEQFFVDYQDQRIYFCCNNCKRDFLTSPDSYLANIEVSGAESSPPESSHEHPEGAHEPAENIAKVAQEDNEVVSDASHNHATDHGDSSSLVTLAGKFHPMLTHFPIALILSALLFSGLTFILKVQTLEVVSVYSVYLAALSGLVTVALGLAAGYGASYPSFLAGYLSTHRLLGIVTGVVTFGTAYFGYRHLQTMSAVNAWIYRGFLLANSVLVGITGHLGATLVFGPDHFDF